jgi:hypothetical protein
MALSINFVPETVCRISVMRGTSALYRESAILIQSVKAQERAH